MSAPVDIVAIRAGEVYTENADPVNSHRLLIQALIKFDITQASGCPSFSIYHLINGTRVQRIDIVDKHGHTIDSNLAGSRAIPSVGKSEVVRYTLEDQGLVPQGVEPRKPCDIF